METFCTLVGFVFFIISLYIFLNILLLPESNGKMVEEIKSFSFYIAKQSKNFLFPLYSENVCRNGLFKQAIVLKIEAFKQAVCSNKN